MIMDFSQFTINFGLTGDVTPDELRNGVVHKLDYYVGDENYTKCNRIIIKADHYLFSMESSKFTNESVMNMSLNSLEFWEELMGDEFDDIDNPVPIYRKIFYKK